MLEQLQLNFTDTNHQNEVASKTVTLNDTTEPEPEPEPEPEGEILFILVSGTHAVANSYAGKYYENSDLEGVLGNLCGIQKHTQMETTIYLID